MASKQRTLREKRDFLQHLAAYDDVALYELVHVGKMPERDNGWVDAKNFHHFVGCKLNFATQAAAYSLLHPKPNDKLDLLVKMRRGHLLAGQAIQRSLKEAGRIETRRNSGCIESRAVEPDMKRPSRTPGLEGFFLDQISAERRRERAKKGAATRAKNREDKLEEAERQKALSVLDQLAAERERRAEDGKVGERVKV